MKSIALIIWLIGSNGSEQVIKTTHLDDMASCEANAATVINQYNGSKTRYLCHSVIEEYGMVDASGNPITSVASH